MEQTWKLKFTSWIVMHRLKATLLFLVLLALIAAAFVLPLDSVPVAVPIAESSAAATAATQLFWEVFHGNRIERAQEAIDAMTAAYRPGLEDPVLTVLLGAAHLWRFQEHARLGKTAAEVREDAVQAQRFGRITVELDPDNTFGPAIVVISGWQLALLDGDSSRIPDLEVDVLQNTQTNPSFNGFVQLWMLPAYLRPDDPHFAAAALGNDLMMEACAGFETPRNMKFNWFAISFLSVRSYLLDPICYNNPIAPHNVGGGFLATGDLYVKAGEIELARIWYENARTSPIYASWPYRDELEDRLARLASDPEALRRKFLADTAKLDVEEPAMSFQAPYGCSSCHARERGTG